MTTDGERWAAWLREQFDRSRTVRRASDLVRASPLKANGRPMIDAARVHVWLSGARPSFTLAKVTADAFGVARASALQAAGYEVDNDDAPRPPRPEIVGTGVDPAALQDLRPEEVQRVLDFIEGIKAGRGN